MNLKPTAEQTLIIDNAIEGRNLAISAFAGAAKTTTCQMIANKVRKHSLYVAYNKSIATEASGKFPMWVDCKTIHSIAWQAVVKGTNYRKKLNSFIDRREVLAVLPELDDLTFEKRVERVNEILTTINEYCNSANESIINFLPDADDKFIFQVSTFWDAMVDVTTSIKISHDVYLKLFQLSKPDLGYQVIYLDECQDANPVILDIVTRQDCQKILVGDQYQAIYAWRGAINAFEHLDDSFSFLDLTTSFRFGQKIADGANEILNLLGCKTKVIGKGTKFDIETEAILVRTNMDLFEQLAFCAETATKAYVVGDLRDLFNKLYSANNLKYDGDPRKRYDKQIASYTTWDELVDAVETSPELAKVVSIVNSYPSIHTIITAIKAIMVTDASLAAITIATAHKSKGLEWDRVTLAPGFINPKVLHLLEVGKITVEEILESNQTGNLLYVAATRGKVEVELPQDVKTLLWIS